MKKLKHWLIRKLGGIVPSDLSTRSRVDILNYQCGKRIDSDFVDAIRYGFETNYVKNHNKN